MISYDALLMDLQQLISEMVDFDHLFRHYRNPNYNSVLSFYKIYGRRETAMLDWQLNESYVGDCFDLKNRSTAISELSSP